jgi:phosphoadenosine phosphosulfate reductase
MLELNVGSVNERFEGAAPHEILAWAWDAFKPVIASTSSFQTQSLPLLYIISQIAPEMPIFFLDTGFHFPETLAFRDQLAERFGLNIVTLKPQVGHDGFKHRYGDLYRHDPDLCCYINKVEPLKRAKEGLKAWVAGIRRDQTPARRNTPIVSIQADGLYKICPLANWTSRDVFQYIHDHDLPDHPLLSQGYLSIGCAPCTRPVSAEGDERSGRWAGFNKTECGLHVVSSSQAARE